MSSRPLRISAALPATRARQMSHPKTFVPLPVARRTLPSRRPVVREMERGDFLRWWSGLMLRKCGSAHAAARRFGRTEQTGRNWIDGVACPTGLDVMRAHEWWPEEFAGAAAWMGRAA